MLQNTLQQSYLRLSTSFSDLLPALSAAIVILLAFWVVARVVRRVTGALSKYIRDETVRMLVTQVSYYLTWTIGLVVMLDAIGVNLQTFVTALGLGSVAIGFALKDILSNLVSGLFILAMRPFEVNDQIVIGETEGTVECVELRTTHIRTYDGRLVLVPNAEIFTSRITNNTASPVRRASVYVYLDYREDTPRAMSLILDTIAKVPGVVARPAPSMRLREFREEHLQIEARFWADSHRTNLMNTASEARVAIVQRLKAAGIQLPDPDQRRVVIAAGDAGVMAS